MISNQPRGLPHALGRLPCLAGVLSLAAGCSSIPPSHVESQPVVPEFSRATSDPSVDTHRGEFTAHVSMLDTWNAIGQMLVRLDGVTYEGRAQMLGIYAVRYRGERFLILTRALVKRDLSPGMLTKVGAVLLDGKPSDGAAAVELLGVLRRGLPEELARIAAGDRGRVQP